MSAAAPGRPAEASSRTVPDQIAALTSLPLDQLRAEWRRLHRAVPPVRLSCDLLRRGIAHTLQEAALGGLPPAVGRKLASLAKSLAAGTEPRHAPALRLKAGVTLIREWHGRTHTVRVLPDGFDYDGRRYASLTQIARDITNAHWSGPRFFGLGRARLVKRTGQQAADA